MWVHILFDSIYIVWFTRKSSQPIVENVYSQRINASN